MNRMFVLFRNDLKSITRDSNQLLFLTTPFLLLLFINGAMPYLCLKFEALEAFKDVTLMFGVVQTAILYGFVSAFALLDERDQNVLDAIRVLPVSSSYYLRYRMAFSFLVTWFGSCMILYFNVLVKVSVMDTLMLSLLFAMLAPLVTFTIAAFARNKVEGMAYFKGLDLLLLLPILAITMGGVWHYIVLLIPSYWAYRSFLACLSDTQPFHLQLELYAGAYIYFFLVIAVVVRLYKKRVYDTL